MTMDDFSVSISIGMGASAPGDSDILDAHQRESLAHRDAFLRANPEYGLKTEGPGNVRYTGNEPWFPDMW